MHAEPLIVARGLSKRFSGAWAVLDVSFTVGRGEAVGLLGENGAGKTTTFRLLSGSLAPTNGSVALAGFSLETEAKKAKRAIGYMPESLEPYPELDAEQYLRFRAELSGRILGRDVTREVARVIELTDIGRGSRQPLSTRSKGYRQRVLLSAALLGNPSVLLLDEPTSGLDPSQIQEFRALVRRLATDRTILLSTHVLSEVEATCSRVLVLRRGRLVADRSLNSASRASARRVMLELSGERSQLEAWCTSLDNPGAELEITWREPDRAKLVLNEDPGQALDLLVERAVGQGFRVQACGELSARLDDLLFSLVRDGGGPSPNDSDPGQAHRRAPEAHEPPPRGADVPATNPRETERRELDAVEPEEASPRSRPK